jgi:hypothetical protein
MKNIEEKASIDNNVLGLSYTKSLILESELIKIESELSKLGYSLKLNDYSGRTMNSLADILSEITLVLNDTTVQQILIGLCTNGIWDGLKSITKSIWLNSKQRKAYTMSSGGIISERGISVAVMMKIDKRKSVEFKLDNLSEDTFDKSFDKIMELVDKKMDFEESKRNVLIFDKENDKWLLINNMIELLTLIPSRDEKKMTIDEFEEYMKQKNKE